MCVKFAVTYQSAIVILKRIIIFKHKMKGIYFRSKEKRFITEK